MLKLLYHTKTSAKIKDHELLPEDFTSANSVFFAVFSRYGDSIIALQIIKEFTNKYPKKQYLLSVSPQMLPYAQEILNSTRIKIKIFSKKNPFSLISIINEAKSYDIGLNPYGYGNESEYLIAWCKKYSFFKTFSKRCNEKNLFDRLRRYLHLDIKMHTDSIVFDENYLANCYNIIICPHSSEERKSLSKKQLIGLIAWIKTSTNYKNIVIATQKNYYKNIEMEIKDKVNFFYLDKMVSDKFLQLCKTIDLAFCVDSGPMHIFNSLGIKNIAYFSATLPQRILDKNTLTLVMRNSILNGCSCEVKSCSEAACLNGLELNENNNLYKLDFKDMGHDIFRCPII